jgi:hypothetical protein
MNLRSKVTYANVVATLALVLALGGGTVYAASQLGKGEVKSKNIAKGAVKGKNLGKNAVTSPKIKDGSIVTGDLAAGVLSNLDADVTGSASAGPQGGLTSNVNTPLPLSGTSTFTPHEGEVSALAAEARFTIASTSAAQSCQPAIGFLVNGQPTRLFVSPDADGNNTVPIQSLGSDAAGPFGLVNPETPLTVTALLRGDVDCTAGSQLDKLQLRIVQIK